MERLKLIVAAILGALAPIQASMITVFGLILVDLISGVIAALRLKTPIESNKLKKTVVKLCVYEVAIVAAYYVGQNLTGPSVPILQMVASVIGLTEFTSILENLRAITGSSVFDLILRNVSAHELPEPPRGPSEDDEPGV